MPKTAFSLYNASAGSGKTYMLVREYLIILLTAPNPDTYRRILAITFTNKAVEEMKTRILGALSDFCKDEPGAKAESLLKEIAIETGLPPATIKEKSKAIVKHIIHNYAAFDISTIDRFTHKVIRAFAHDLNLPISFDVSLETDALLREAVDAVIAKAGDNEVLTSLLVDFSLDKTDNDKSWDVTYELFETGKLLTNENNRLEIGQLSGKSIEEFLFIREKLRQEVKSFKEQNHSLGVQMLRILEDNGVDAKSFTRGTFTSHIEFIRDTDPRACKYRFENPEDVGINKTANRTLIEGLLPEILPLLAKAYENLRRHDFYEAFLKNITPLSLLNSIGQELDRIQQEQNVLSISEFNAIIHKEIQNQPAPFIYERLGERYRHFFIDEFQDTSVMQWQNLIPLIDNALASEDLQQQRGSLMIVGDPKQSIYRWRGGRAEQFIGLGKGHNPFSNPDRALKNLERNYRSFDTVIQFNNAFFARLASEFADEDYATLYRDNSFQECNDKTGGYVEISFLPEQEQVEDGEPESRDEQYLKATLATINKVLAQGYSYSDIVLLTRKRQPGVLLAAYLTENAIPILSSETLLIENASEVKLIISLLRYLKNNANAEAKAHFLYYASTSLGAGDATHDFIADGMAQPTETALEEWLATKGIKISFGECRRKSLYEAVERIIDAFLKNKANQSYVQYFLDLVLERDIRTQAGISDFLEYWDNNGSRFSIPSPEGSNAVRIMTIHKSKGLEFPVVIFPFAEEDYARARRDKLWLEFDDDSLGLQKALIDSRKEVSQYGEKAAELYSAKAQEELLDNINILYVALTRAEEQLYIISAKNFNRTGELPSNMSSYFIGFLQDRGMYDNTKDTFSFGCAQRISAHSHQAAPSGHIQVVKEHFDTRGVKIAQRESLMWGTTQLEAIEFGNVMHEVLSFVGHPNDIPVALMRAVESGLITSEQAPDVEYMLKEVTGHPMLNAHFAENSIIYKEQSIIHHTAGTLKPDRVTIKDNTAWLLDYKTGAHLPKYEKQLAEYQKALEQLGLRVAEKALVYIGEGIEVMLLEN